MTSNTKYSFLLSILFKLHWLNPLYNAYLDSEDPDEMPRSAAFHLEEKSISALRVIHRENMNTLFKATT